MSLSSEKRIKLLSVDNNSVAISFPTLYHLTPFPIPGFFFFFVFFKVITWIISQFVDLNLLGAYYRTKTVDRRRIADTT